MQSEKITERYLNKRVKEAGGWSLKLSSQFVAGLPDRIVLLPRGKMLFVELKSEGQKPRKIQKFIHDKLRRLGFAVYVVDTKEGVDAITQLSNKN
jgi:hypothetical protein